MPMGIGPPKSEHGAVLLPDSFPSLSANPDLGAWRGLSLSFAVLFSLLCVLITFLLYFDSLLSCIEMHCSYCIGDLEFFSLARYFAYSNGDLRS
ncbi:hypothetical protein BDV12DRAFT_97496 [Aspergillus spectabilis]